MPDAGIYIEGELLPEEMRLALQHAPPPSAPTPSERPVPPPEPEKLRDYAETMQHAFEDVRKGYVQNLRDIQDCAKRFSELWIEREQQFANEAARQRELMHKSLADVDLLGRSVKAVQLDDVLAMSSVNTSARSRRSDGVTLLDFVGGLFKTIANDR
ncbi:hypothetical protein OV079_02500 [Nannocystis pusilla]|uniref:Uncharacterized protein n=1 Tax=Nannocystis pusilla TaxID=889268 RepID=A0A9X3EIS3_9BACT|nr:hypothetical protein [Nannocystis pusilla]MCY1004456.1 hypothetical protein [Nannocystis pusilla]